MSNRRPHTTHHNRDVSRPYLHHQKTMRILIVIRRRWDDSMSRCAVLYGSNNVHECWYRRCTLLLTHIPERQSYSSRTKHIWKRFFILRRILDTRRKNVNIVNDSSIRQYHIDHRRSWLKRPSWGGRASPMSIIKDGCVVCDLRTFKYNTSQSRGVAWPYLHHQKRWVY